MKAIDEECKRIYKDLIYDEPEGPLIPYLIIMMLLTISSTLLYDVSTTYKYTEEPSYFESLTTLNFLIIWGTLAALGIFLLSRFTSYFFICFAPVLIAAIYCVNPNFIFLEYIKIYLLTPALTGVFIIHRHYNKK